MSTTSWARERDDAEDLYLDVLGTLIHAYEEAHVVIPELSGLELLGGADS